MSGNPRIKDCILYENAGALADADGPDPNHGRTESQNAAGLGLPSVTRVTLALTTMIAFLTPPLSCTEVFAHPPTPPNAGAHRCRYFVVKLKRCAIVCSTVCL